jgi:hypothetical protein
MSTSFSACAGCRHLEAVIEKLQARLAELEAENARLRLQDGDAVEFYLDTRSGADLGKVSQKKQKPS